MDREQLEQYACSYLDGSALNRIPSDGVYTEGVGGMLMFDPPVFAYGAASDPLFKALAEPSVIGPHHQTPSWWLPTAETVISFFLPFSAQVKADNSADDEWPSNAWYHARIEGQRLLLSLAFHLSDRLADAGYRSVVPDSREMPERADPRFRVGTVIHTPEGDKPLRFTSNWSERHAAYICGLGTFCLTRSLITEKGCAGRFGSMITELKLPTTPRKYAGPFEYCTECGVCIPKCPAHAITLENGKDQEKCKAFLDRTRTHPPYYGCGKCQVGVPCESGIPRGPKARQAPLPCMGSKRTDPIM